MIEDKLSRTPAKDIRVVAHAYVSGDGQIMRVADVGSSTLHAIWQRMPPCEFAVVEFEGSFYTIHADSFFVNSKAFMKPTEYTVHGDIDAAIIAGILKSSGRDHLV